MGKRRKSPVSGLAERQNISSASKRQRALRKDAPSHEKPSAQPDNGPAKMSATETTHRESRCGFVALVGAPNVGKSTLVNALVGTKVSIISHKVQTTRALLRGIATVGFTQLVFIDTPGIFSPKRRLDRAMVTSAWTSAHDADIAGVMIDAKQGINAEAGAILDRLGEVRQQKIVIINKIDLVQKPALLALASELNTRREFAATFMVSALSGNGVDDLRRWLAEHAPPGPWHYPPDQISDAPLRSQAAEITREKLYQRLHQELPYQSTVETEVWKEMKDGSVRIEQTIYVERESQRKIVLGKGGQTIKAIGAEARREISEIIEAPAHLFLFVKVREGWGEDPERYRQMGLDFPKE
jgi:GTP-binding protein Era